MLWGNCSKISVEKLGVEGYCKDTYRTKISYDQPYFIVQTLTPNNYVEFCNSMQLTLSALLGVKRKVSKKWKPIPLYRFLNLGSIDMQGR